ncbi:hypothetical protein [Granulicella mallensis]|uniref:Uncharacterized protein n=1 Tax=Granulicella mallensis TaxID=940614 RepID=A0A7W8EB68_9BACT|nr:hypothetical protein [Granulicella mallensis]MBB5066393.1 hypothetical protein [Granulicella mallensis]
MDVAVDAYVQIWRTYDLGMKIIAFTCGVRHARIARMIDSHYVQRSAYLRLLRWRICFRYLHKVFKILGSISLGLFCVAALLWHHFGTDLSLPVLADSTPILLAIVGIIMSFIPPKKETAHIVACFVLIVIALVGTAVLTAVRLRGENSHKAEINTLGAKLDAVGSQNTKLSNFLIEERGTGRMTEADRRRGIETTLRNEYILSHDPIDPEILAGTKMPPAAWMKEKLHDLGENWTVSEEVSRTAVPSPRSYIVLAGGPKFTGPNTAGIEGSDFIAGSAIAFNIHYKNTGPNSIQLVDQAAVAFLKDDYKPETQKAVLTQFAEEVKREKKAFNGPKPDASNVHTVGAGTEEFITDSEWSDTWERIAFTQDDLDALKTGTKIAFVLNEITYKDAGTIHHFRMCMWLQPPAASAGIWHYCQIFNDSD